MAFRIFRFIVFPLTALWSITGALAGYCPTTGTSTTSSEIGSLLIECDPTSSVFCLSWCCASNTYACLAATPISSCAGTIGGNFRQLQTALFFANAATDDATFCSKLQQGLKNVPSSNPCIAYGQNIIESFGCNDSTTAADTVPAQTPNIAVSPQELLPPAPVAASTSNITAAPSPAEALSTPQPSLLTSNFTGAASIYYPGIVYSVQAPGVICMAQSTLGALPQSTTLSTRTCVNVSDATASILFAKAVGAPASAPALLK